MKTAQEIATIAQQQLQAEVEVENAEAALKKAKTALRQVAEVELPEAMREAEMTSFTLDNGFKIVVKNEVRASISVVNRDDAHEWLREHGFGALIKTLVTVAFPREKVEEALVYAQDATERFGDDRVDLKESVHDQTLKAWLREQLAEGTPIPMELFGVEPYSIAKITAPKNSGR